MKIFSKEIVSIDYVENGKFNFSHSVTEIPEHMKIFLILNIIVLDSC